MSQNLSDVQDALTDSRTDPGRIRDRLPAKLTSEQTRAAVCAIRNPEATADEVAATSGTDRDDLYEALALTAEDRHPLVGKLTGVRPTLYDVLTTEDLDPEAVLADEDELQRVASTVGRLAERAVNPEYVANILDRDDVTRQCDATRIDGIVTDQMQTAHGVSNLMADIGLRRVVRALGEQPPDDNLDRIMSPTTTEAGAQIGITTDYVIAEDTWDGHDIRPHVAYWAKVNNKEGYGIFVTLAGSGYDDISGLVHRRYIPGMLSVDDFRVGDEVMVRLIRRQGNGDLGFELAGVIDALNVPTQEFKPRAKYKDLGDAAGVDEDELVAEAAEAKDEAADEADDDGRAYKPIKADTTFHEVLQGFADIGATEDDPAVASALREHLDGQVSRGSLSSRPTHLYERRLLDRVAAPEGASELYAYYLTAEGEAMLDELGRPETDAEPEPEPTPTYTCDCDESFDDQRAYAAHRRWCDEARAERGDDSPAEPELTMQTETTTDDEAQTTADTDFAGDVQMMAGMAIGRGDVSADEAAASLRKVADRLEHGGPSTWA